MGAVGRELRDMYGVVGGKTLTTAFELVGKSLRVERVGFEERCALGAAIECTWHQHHFIFGATDTRRVPYTALLHPAPYIAPWRHHLAGMGHAFVLGSTGNRGRESQTELAGALQSGRSTFIFPDGPAGPPGVPRNGALRLSLASGRPIVPIRYEVTPALRAPSWDRTVFPVLGAEVRITYGEAFVVDDLERGRARLVEALGPL